MSRTQLKKELVNLTREQLIEVILDAYTARPEVKEYFDFYINPDIRKLTASRFEKVKKEVLRTKWGTCKARSSVIKKMVKDYCSFSPGETAVIDFHYDVLRLLTMMETSYDFPVALMNCVRYLTTNILAYSSRSGMLDEGLRRIEMLTGEQNKNATRHMKSTIIEACNEAIEKLKAQIK